MGMMQTVLARLGYEKRSAPDMSWQGVATGGYLPALSPRGVENLSAVLGCTTAISSALASIPFLIYRREAGARIEAEAHPLARLVRNGANANMTFPDMMEHLLSSTLMTGNGLVEIERDNRGQLAALHFIPWHHASVVELASGRLAYDISDGTRHYRLLQGEVIHLRDRTDNGRIGRSRLSRAADTIEAVRASNDFARNFHRNSAMPSGAIISPAALNPEQFENLRAQFDERFSGTGNAGRAMVLDAGLDFKPFQLSPEDSELLESRKFGVEEICRIFQVPPPLVQDYSHNTFTNSETAGRWFAMFCLAPWARKIEAEFARSVFSTNGAYELELDLSGFLRGDPATRWSAHAIALQNNVLDPDEVRQVEGWNPRPQAQQKAAQQQEAKP